MTAPEKCPLPIRCQCGGRIGPLDSICPSCRRPKPRIEAGLSDTDQPAQFKGGGFSAIAGSLVFGLAALAVGYFIFSKQQAAQQEAAATGGALEETLPAPHDGWMIKGRIYDLMTLRPVAGTQLTLKNTVSGQTFSTRTDAGGAYSLRVFPVSEGGYAVSILLHGRAWPFLEDTDPPYKERSQDLREPALELLSSPSLVHVPIMLANGQRELAYDLVLAAP